MSDNNTKKDDKTSPKGTKKPPKPSSFQKELAEVIRFLGAAFVPAWM